MVNSADEMYSRCAGVLLHPTSLPDDDRSGVLGRSSRRFIDLLAEAGFRAWQMLPLGPTDEHFSPYATLSAFAGNPKLIGQTPSDPESSRPDAFAQFCQDHATWLETFAQFSVLRDQFSQRSWWTWPVSARDRVPSFIDRFVVEHRVELERVKAVQFEFFRQLGELRSYAEAQQVRLIGDVPFFVNLDSADVWAHRDQYRLDEKGSPTHVAGVPPDYFSATGQRWGHPHYDWQAMQNDQFAWWRARIAFHRSWVDQIRIDHFRGFAATWQIPASSADAITGEWVTSPGDRLLESLKQDGLISCLIAEDLGHITLDVVKLRDKYLIPGTKVLQFAFDGANNPHLNHNHSQNSVVYTGTHDNNTSLGWYRGLALDGRHVVDDYLGFPKEAMPDALIRCALRSVAKLAILPLQDCLELGAYARMNTPGTTKGNWRWRFDWLDVSASRLKKLREMLITYGR